MPDNQDKAEAERLLKAYDGLRTYTQVAEWDRQAGDVLERIQREAQRVQTQIADLQLQIQREQSERDAKSFFQKLFASQAEQKQLEIAVTQHQATIAELSAIADRLESSIAITPDDKTAKTAMLKELRFRKRELNARKKEVSAATRAITVEARQASAEVGTDLIGAFSSSSRRAQRMSIRLNKEAALRPHETEKAAIDRQLVYLDKMIMWLERFEA